MEQPLEDLIKDRFGSFESIDDTCNKQNGHDPREMVMSRSKLVD